MGKTISGLLFLLSSVGFAGECERKLSAEIAAYLSSTGPSLYFTDHDTLGEQIATEMHAVIALNVIPVERVRHAYRSA